MSKNKKKTPPVESAPPVEGATAIANAPAETETRISLPLFEIPPTRNTWPENFETRPGSVELSEHDFGEKGKHQAALHQEIEVLVSQKKTVASDYAAKIKKKESELLEVTRQILAGSTIANLQCRWIYEYRGRREDGSWIPDVDGKTLVRCDDWSVQATGSITGEDRQTVLNLPPADPVHSVVTFPEMEAFLETHGYTLSESGDDAAPFRCEGPTGVNNINESSRDAALAVAYLWVKDLVEEPGDAPEAESAIDADEPETAEGGGE